MIDDSTKQTIKTMIEQGFAVQKLSAILKLPSEKEARELVKKSGWVISKEVFDETKIDFICDLYEQGVSAKSLGQKFHIGKSKVQKWANERGFLRGRDDSHRITFYNQNAFDIIDTPAKAYCLGFFYADAYNCDMTNTFSIGLSDKDYEHLTKLADLIGFPTEKIRRFMTVLNGKSYPTCSINFYSKHLCTKMTELGCPRAKSLIIKYPEWLPHDLDVHFIRGLFEGDGSLKYKPEYKEWGWSLVSTLEGCISLNRIILANTGIDVPFHCISETENNTYELEQSGNEKILELLHWLYKDADQSIRMDRKYDRYLLLGEQQDNRSFLKREGCSRTNYLLTKEQKQAILDDIESEMDINLVAQKHGVHSKTVKRTIERNQVQ